MQLSRVSTDESAHSSGMLEDDLFDGVGDMRLRDYDFLVDMIKLLREGTTRILPILGEGGTKHLRVHTFRVIEIISIDDSLPNTLNDQLFDTVMQRCIRLVFPNSHE